MIPLYEIYVIARTGSARLSYKSYRSENYSYSL